MAMPLTSVDRTAALIVIDLQKGLLGTPTLPPTSEVIRKSAKLAAAFRKRGLPVVLVNVAAAAPGRTDIVRPKVSLPTDFKELVPELNQQPNDILITKERVGAFLGTSLDEQLRQGGVTQVFVTGIATSSGVEATARSAYDLGYHVVLVTDAMTDRDPDNHRHSVERIFPRLGETASTEEAMKLLQALPASPSP